MLKNIQFLYAWIATCLIIALFLTRAESQEIIPNQFDTVNLTYTRSGVIINENFDAPRVANQKLFTPVYIDKSPRDPSRSLNNIPNFGLAFFHHWLFGEVVLRNAQTFYAICVGELRAETRRLRLLDPLDARSPLKGAIESVLAYHVPFLAVQNGVDKHLPPKREDAVVHAVAAIDSVNFTVANLKACEGYRDYLRGLK